MQAARESGEQSPVWKWRYILAGGAPPVAQSLTACDGDLLCTGHRDGRVRMWDATAEVQGGLFCSSNLPMHIILIQCFD